MNNVFRLTLIASLLTTFGVAVAQEPVALLLDSDAPSAVRDASEMPGAAVRSRFADLNSAALPPTPSPGRAPITLNLFGDRTFEGLLERLIYRGEGDYTWAGRIEGEPFGSLVLTVKDGACVGTFRTASRGQYELRPTAFGAHRVSEIDPLQFGGCGCGELPDGPPPPAPLQGRPSRANDSPDVMDVLIVYTQDVRTALGGTAAAQALVNQSVDLANLAYEASNINTRIRLVFQSEVTYAETGDSQTDLNRLGAADGQLDQILTWRNTYGADFVSMFVTQTTYSICGLAWVMAAANVNQAFSIIRYGCAASNLSYAHELGHNFGSNHQRAALVEPQLSYRFQPYSYGWTWSTKGGSGRGSIMAVSTTRTGFFSNPKVTSDGVPTGVTIGLAEQADDKTSFDLASNHSAQYRATVFPMYIAPGRTALLTGPEGGPFTGVCASYAVKNVGGAAFNWSASANQTWITVSPSSGTVAASGQTSVTLCANSNANALAKGTYAATVTFTDTTNADATAVNVSLEVTDPYIHTFTMDANPGWTLEGQWQYGVPQGGGTGYGDPTSGFTGTKVVGYNLAGDYPNNLVSDSATTPPLDFTGVTGTTLRFRRWLGLEAADAGQFGMQLSTNGSSWRWLSWDFFSGAEDNQWVEDVIDISSWADDQPSVQIRWVMAGTDGDTTLYGLNLDDVVFTGIAPPPSTVWVDFARTGTEDGSQSLPFNTLAEALDKITRASTGEIVFNGASSNTATSETPTIDFPLRLTVRDGTVRIGQP